MSRPIGSQSPSSDAAPSTSDSPDPERARMIENIGLQALELARYARAADLPLVGFMLEAAALEAATEVATSRLPSDETR